MKDVPQQRNKMSKCQLQIGGSIGETLFFYYLKLDLSTLKET